MMWRRFGDPAVRSGVGRDGAPGHGQPSLRVAEERRTGHEPTGLSLHPPAPAGPVLLAEHLLHDVGRDAVVNVPMVPYTGLLPV